jgi:negative regulator of flagellin synthesis FlgM
MVIDFSRLNNSTSVGSASRTASTKEASKTEATATVSSGTESVSGSGEAVHLSSEAQQLQKITDSLRDQPVVNSSRVAELKAQIDSGTYQVDSKSVAAKMLNFEAQR